MKHLDIKRTLSDHNITQVQLGEKLGLSPQSLTSVIKGNPTVAKLMQIAEGIGCDITDLFYPDPEEEAETQERRNKEMEQEIEKGLESAKDSKNTLEQTLRDLTRRAYPSITEEEVKEWVEAVTKKKGVQKFDMTPKGLRGLADMIDLEATRKKHEGETLNADIRGFLPEDFICKDMKFISETPGESQTSTFCPHCGKKVRVGVVLLPEE